MDGTGSPIDAPSVMPQANCMGILGMVYWIMDLEISKIKNPT
jgi:hypothetical protein